MFPPSTLSSRLEFRPLRADEADEACALAREVFDRFIAPTQEARGIRMFHGFAQPGKLLPRHTTRYTSWVAAAGPELVAMLHIPACNHISMLFVAPGQQGRGCGAELVRIATQASALRPPLTVNASPNAVGFYAKLGFASTGPEQTINGVRFQSMRQASPLP